MSQPYIISVYENEEQEQNDTPASVHSILWHEVIHYRLFCECYPKSYWFAEREVAVVAAVMVREHLPFVYLAKVERDGKKTFWRQINLQKKGI